MLTLSLVAEEAEGTALVVVEDEEDLVLPSSASNAEDRIR
jgi:hypothetical protein